MILRQEKAYVRAVAIATLLIALINPVVGAQSPEAAGSARGISCWPDPEPILLSEELQDDAIEMSAGDVDIAGDGNARFEGPVTMRSREMSLTAGSASYDSDSATFTAQGGIEFQDRGNKIRAESVSYDTRNEIFSSPMDSSNFHKLLPGGLRLRWKHPEPVTLKWKTWCTHPVRRVTETGYSRPKASK